VALKNNLNYLKETIPHFCDEYELAYHSLHVTIYAISLSYFLNLDDEQLLQVGTAALLHDVGIKKINESIPNKDSKLSLEELEAIHQHTKYSSEIAGKNYIHDPYILNAIMHHHEYHDATGYPDQLESKDISDFASTLCISDVFDALTSNRPYRKKYSTFDALKIMMQEESMVNRFNQKYLKVFLQSLLK
jgi:HD-GYP domain-containing protein (c-di-GMP phosphodiesterase class II)